MVRRIPQNQRWSGPYLGKYQGDLWKTHNIDLDREEGAIGLSKRLDTVADTSDTNSDTLDLVTAFLRTNSDCVDRYWALSRNGNLYKVDSSPTGDWVVDTLANSPTDAKDFATFENDSTGDTGRLQLFVTRDGDISSLNDTGDRAWVASWWVTAKSQAALKSSIPHPICYFPFRRIMVVGDANRIHTWSRTSVATTEAVTNSRLILPTELQVHHIFTTSNRVWILCANLYSGNGKIVEWDGFSQTYNNIYDAYSRVPLAGVSYREIPIILNHKGMFLEFTGNGFSPMVRNGQKVAFPVVDEAHNTLSIDEISFFTGVQPKGMVVGEDQLIYVNMVQPQNANYRQGAGIWCLNPITGRLYSKYSIGQWSGGNGDFGQQRIQNAGALYSIPFGVSSRGLLAGGIVYSVFSSSLKSAIWVLATYETATALRGYFITQYIPASEIKEFWDTLWIHFKKFATAANRIVVKARGIKPLYGTPTYLPNEQTITWTGASSFTVTLAAGDEALAVGDEVEVIAGDNAGTLSHILTISGAHGALQTITIDETMTVSSTAARARFDRWKKLGVISTASKDADCLPVGIDSSFIQFKVELRGPSAEMEVSDIVLNSKPSIYNQK